MARNYPYVYPYSLVEARHRKETRQHERSFCLNASCAQAIEQAINDYYTDAAEKLREGCAQSVLERYGFKRVIFVLANSLYETGCPFLISDETLQWALKTYVPNDGKYNREFPVHLGGTVLEAFVSQTRQAYSTVLKNVGQRAASMIDAIHGDLQKNAKSIRNISFGDKNALSRQVQELSNVCSMTGVSSGRSMECVFLLNQSAFPVSTSLWFDESAIRSAINQIKSNPDFFASEGLSIVRKAADWGIESAAGNDKRKAKFLEAVSQKKGRDFLRRVLEAYQEEEDTSVPTGFNGAVIGSGDYLQRIERNVFLSDLSMAYSARFGSPSYTSLLRDSLKVCSHKGINHKRKVDKGQKDNVQFVIAGKNSTKPLQTAKKPLDLIPLLV